MERESFGPKKLLLIIVEVLLVIILAFVAVGLIQLYWIGAIGVVGSSMSPTIKSSGSKVYINKAYKNLEKGDVVIVYIPEQLGSYKGDGTKYTLADFADDKEECPATKKTTFSDFIRSLPFVRNLEAGEDTGENGYKRVIKRVVGCPGDVIAFVDGELYVNNVKEEKFVYTWSSLGVTDHLSNNYNYKLGEGEYFILGDNRGNSNDSEDYGPIKASWIYGKAFLLAQDGKLDRNI